MTGCDKSRLREFLHELIPTEEQYEQLYQRFCEQIRKGLGQKTNKDASTKCYITYVQDVASGNEKGKYLALDLGGSRFRVLLITLKGRHEAEQIAKIFDLSEKELKGPGEMLFDYIAKCLHEFVCEHKLEKEELPLGFTFSFPCVQTGITKAMLVRWTKGFNCSGVVGEDVGRLMKQAIARRTGLKIEVVAILNDTTGTLMSCAYLNPECCIGLIIGTGSNACYVEKVENCERLEAKFKDKPQMIINIEWGAFGEKGELDSLITEYDKLIDSTSINAGMQLFEKMVAGMYLGELVRLILLRAVKENLIFETCALRKKLTDIMQRNRNCIETHVLSDIAEDKPPEFPLTVKALNEIFKLKNPDPDDCEKFKFICDAISQRAGNMIGVFLAGIINKIGEPKAIVGVDGSLYRLHPLFDYYMREMIDKFKDRTYKYDLMLSEDGSGRGAALVAAVVSNARDFEKKIH